MSPSSRRPSREELIAEWQQPIYGYLIRTVRNPESAADLTQEVFTRALADFDRIRDPERWLFRVAANLVRERGRRDRARVERERRVAVAELQMSDPDDSETDALLRIERELDALPEDQRSLLVLHYYGGLSQRAIADCLDLPRTTVADRLRASLNALKRRLQQAGLAALVPGVEATMRSAPAIAVPETLSLTLASLAATSGVSGGISLGLAGLLVSQKLVAVTAVVALVTFFAGWGTQSWVASSKAVSAEEAAAERVTQLQADLDESIGQAERLRSELERSRARASELEERLAEATTRVEELAAIVPASASAVSSSEEEGPKIDWDGLRALAAENREVLLAIADLAAAGSGSRGLTPEMQSKRQVLIAELEKIAALVRLECDHPMLDERFFPKIMDTYLGAFLDLDDAQRDALSKLSRDAVNALEYSDSVTPRELFELRQALVSDVADRFANHMTPEQRDDFDQIQPVWQEIRTGSTRRLDVGIDRSDLDEFVGREWVAQFGLSDEHRAWVEDEVAAFIGQARTLVQDVDFAALSGAQRTVLDDHFRDLQLEFERRVLDRLPDDQRAEALGRMPSIFRFQPGGGTSINNNRAPGF